MLWLTAMMGLVGVGAASFAVVQLQEEPEETEPEVFDDLEQTGNLLDDHFDTEDEETKSPEENTADARDPLLAASYDDIIFDDDPIKQSQDGINQHSSDKVLNDIVRDPFGGGFIDLDAAPTDADALPDTAPPEDAASQILLGDWIMEGQPSEVLDYETEKDSLMLVWDDMMDGAAEPDVDVAPDPYDNEVMHVLMNGKSVAEVYGDPELSVSDVTIIPLSSALIVGLEPA